MPYLTLAKQALQDAIGTSSACTFPIALSAVVAYLILGSQSSNETQSYIHWSAFFGITSTSILFAIVGVHLIKYISVTKLKRAFSLILLSVALYLFFRQ